MRRRRDALSEFNVWPAFTDALSGLVMVLIFLITVFVIAEVLIGREMMGKETAIGQLQRIISHLEGLAGDADKEAARLRSRVQSLESTVGERDKLLAQLRNEQAALSADKSKAEQTATSVQEQAALLSARAERLAAELERLNRALAANQQDLAQRDAVIIQQKGRIEALDSALKKKLLERVEELEKYASDFFGRLREVFANNPDIKVVGDRFVFQSEVLFASGEAMLSASGGGDLDKFAAVYRQLAAKLPPDLPVIIEVQGHTDRVPVRGRFPSNWELSTARAQQVVNYLIQQGIPPQRLAAVGMAEYHPIDPADNADAYRRNRRIELKITSR
ncbi:MAG: Outer membrane protein II* [Candidatus Accumulibacter sp. BA-94]|nr:MAG: Outer membrane protein II* [Candidatus Accumulibacter sp. BA-94]MBL8248822.1 peptidoglycan -binding protein [Candidatus Competibacter sp.]MDG4605128.1 peptidoglycan -binding protein [Candidatus Contendobacter sp.]HRD50941.1 peptidoglycan -binding protein [Candidatus Contendobacter sp.]